MNQIQFPYRPQAENEPAVAGDMAEEGRAWGKYSRAALFLLRVSTGWMMFYAGITKILDPAWSAGGYLNAAKTLPWLFGFFAQPNVLPVINFVNEWGLALLGASLMLGLGVRVSSVLGAVLMMLYYLPILDFPYPNPHSFIVDEHVIYAAALLYFAAVRAGRVWGLDGWMLNWRMCAEKFPRLRNWIG